MAVARAHDQTGCAHAVDKWVLGVVLKQLKIFSHASVEVLRGVWKELTLKQFAGYMVLDQSASSSLSSVPGYKITDFRKVVR